ncbi:hypothetical protein KZZ52_31075 [Dactylosporangium sp. AC04546]|uniref:hypothetical protein n=1 Tax=Dactylosporangium sp. AC04546 TaxID=2862460 RepID=UPI001EDE1705|nr:hypothetical protein [Dactylosporangium sp. AC04546]WVK78437.1 hypothetical protein KZZ52_31075 [Dactylosporangium sp. AC04546]
MRCAVGTAAAVVDAGQNQSSVWLEVATTLLGFGRYAFVPHAAAGCTDLGSLQECPERDYRS